MLAYYFVSFCFLIPHFVLKANMLQLQTGPSAIPLTLGLISSNYKGVTKKMTVTAIVFVTYCAGNIAGPQTFKASEAKR